MRGIQWPAFIRLTQAVSGKPVTLNIADISGAAPHNWSITPPNSGCSLVMTNGRKVLVREPYKEVADTLKDYWGEIRVGQIPTPKPLT